MTSFQFLPASITLQETEDTSTLQTLAHAIWYPAYQDILSMEQIAYMLQEIYTPESLQKQIEEGQTFLLVRYGDTPVGFAAYSPLTADHQLYKLNKLYIHPEYKGKSLGVLLLKEVIHRAKSKGAQILELNVHRKNPAFHFYVKHGFEIFQTKDIPFGPYTLNDYILRLKLL